MIPVFSIIIPNYNHGKFLRRRIESILSQANQLFEIIIIDDASTDDSVAIIEQYRSHHKVSDIILNTKNSGAPLNQWKKAVKCCRAEWIWIAESDDWAEPLFLTEMHRLIEAYEDTGIFYCDSSIHPSQDNYNKHSARKTALFKTAKWQVEYCKSGFDELNEFLKYDCTLNNMSAIVFSKKLFDTEVENLPFVRYYADWALIISVATKTKIAYSPLALNNHQLHEDSFTGSSTSLIQAKSDYFNILNILHKDDHILNKRLLVEFFSYNYLSVGLKQEGRGALLKAISFYLATNFLLGLKVVFQILLIKLFYKRKSEKLAFEQFFN